MPGVVKDTQVIKDLLLALSERPIAFHRAYSQLSIPGPERNGKPTTIRAGVTAGLFLSQAMYWTGTLSKDRDGWFYKTHKDWEEETGLTRTEQDTARKKLKAMGVLDEKVKKADGNPTVHYRVNLDRLAQLLAECVNPAKPMCESCKTLTETTTENNVNKATSRKRSPSGQPRYVKEGWMSLGPGRVAPVLIDTHHPYNATLPPPGITGDYDSDPT